MMSISMAVSQKFESIITLRISYSNSECTADAKILLTVKQRNQLMYLSIDDWIFSCKEEIMPFSGKLMELKFMSVEISLMQKYNYHDIYSESRFSKQILK